MEYDENYEYEEDIEEDLGDGTYFPLYNKKGELIVNSNYDKEWDTLGYSGKESEFIKGHFPNIWAKNSIKGNVLSTIIRKSSNEIKITPVET
jgi:hypothetical protein